MKASPVPVVMSAAAAAAARHRSTSYLLLRGGGRGWGRGPGQGRGRESLQGGGVDRSRTNRSASSSASSERARSQARHDGWMAPSPAAAWAQCALSQRATPASRRSSTRPLHLTKKHLARAASGRTPASVTVPHAPPPPSPASHRGAPARCFGFILGRPGRPGSLILGRRGRHPRAGHPRTAEWQLWWSIGEAR